jgi:hypothetical protein
MKIRIVGAGFYGCHLAKDLLDAGHDVEVHESRSGIFQGASGSIPARIHQGFHYPRSKKTRDACLRHADEFEKHYAPFIRSVGTNIYAIAQDRSLVDFEQYVDTLSHEVPFEIIRDLEHYGLQNVEGALLTEEKHIVTDDVRAYYEKELGPVLKFGIKPDQIDDPKYDLTVDATFCAYDNEYIDRFEPCVVGLLEGDCDTAVTIMDGPFGSLYPWNPDKRQLSLSSAKYTPFSKSCRTYQEAQAILHQQTNWDRTKRIGDMAEDVAKYYPKIKNFEIKKAMVSVRAMPLSGADTRLIDILKIGKTGLRVRAGKIDAVVEAAAKIRSMIV